MNEFVCIAPDVKLGKDVRLSKFINLYGCEVGDGTKIGAFVEIQKNAKIGKNCKISSHTFVCEGVVDRRRSVCRPQRCVYQRLLSPGHRRGRPAANRAGLESRANPGEKACIDWFRFHDPIEGHDWRKRAGGSWQRGDQGRTCQCRSGGQSRANFALPYEVR